MKRANPYLNFPGNTEEAFNYYRSIFGGEFEQVMRFRDFPGNPMGIPEQELDRIAHIALTLGDSTLMATDLLESWPPATQGTNFYINVEADSVEEAERLFHALADGGSVEMELQKTEWAEKYGTCTDRYGVQWMLLYADAG